MASDRPLRAAHVGLSTGHAGSFDDSKPRLIHDVRRLEGVEVVAYCETYDSSFLDDAKKHNPGAGLYSSLDDMLAKEEFDFAAVVLHPSDVAPALLKLAEAGKHFMVDKQFARKSEELIPVTKAVLRNNLTTFMLYPWRYHPAALDIRRLIEEDVLGEPVDIESRQFWGQVGGPLGKDINAPAHRLDTEGGGVLHYIGCHHLDLMRAVMGCEVKSVQAMTGRPFGHMEEPDGGHRRARPRVRERRIRQPAPRLHEADHRGRPGLRQRVRAARRQRLGGVDAGGRQPARGDQRVAAVAGRTGEDDHVRPGATAQHRRTRLVLRLDRAVRQRHPRRPARTSEHGGTACTCSRA